MTSTPLAFKTEQLSGWGNHPRQQCSVADPDSAGDLQDAISSKLYDSFVPRGLGRSYGDSSLNEAVLRLTRQNRFLAFDRERGILRCEAGVSLNEIIQVALPHGWFLPTTPGTKFVTLGGAVAADVHGKNHHRDGSIGAFVRNFRLLVASGEIITCSTHQNTDVFWATIGGMGLTGLILTIEIRLRKVDSAYCRVRYVRTSCIDETLEVFQDTNAEYDHSVAWIDCLSSGAELGRSVIMLGNDAARDDLPSSQWHAPFQMPKRRRKSVPFHFPSFALNRWTVRQFNRLYYWRHPNRESLLDFDRFFYPLDAVSHWNRIYGRRGFIQYQVLFPPETSRPGLIELLERIARSGKASFLSVLKSSGDANDGMLSFLHPGHTLALDLPNTGESLKALVGDLDEIVLRHSGRLYLAKDAMMNAETFAAMYPRLAEFREVKARVDPHNLFVSSQARRVGIVS